MPAHSRVLIKDAIERLEALAEILSMDTHVRRSMPQDLSPDERTRKELDLSIRVLLPKLRAVRVRDDRICDDRICDEKVSDERLEPPRGRVCLDCED